MDGRKSGSLFVHRIDSRDLVEDELGEQEDGADAIAHQLSIHANWDGRDQEPREDREGDVGVEGRRRPTALPSGGDHGSVTFAHWAGRKCAGIQINAARRDADSVRRDEGDESHPAFRWALTSPSVCAASAPLEGAVVGQFRVVAAGDRTTAPDLVLPRADRRERRAARAGRNRRGANCVPG